MFLMMLANDVSKVINGSKQIEQKSVVKNNRPTTNILIHHNDKK